MTPLNHPTYGCPSLRIPKRVIPNTPERSFPAYRTSKSGHGSKSSTPSEHPNPTTKIGSKMGGEFTYPINMGSQNGFDNHSQVQKKKKKKRVTSNASRSQFPTRGPGHLHFTSSFSTFWHGALGMCHKNGPKKEVLNDPLFSPQKPSSGTKGPSGKEVSFPFSSPWNHKAGLKNPVGCRSFSGWSPDFWSASDDV